MLPRQRQLAAIDHELTDRVSVDAICVENVDAIAQHLGIDSGAVHDRLGIDGRLVAAGYTGPVGEPIEGQPVNAWGSVDSGDLATLLLAFGGTGAADTDGDGDTDGADFLAWQQQFAVPSSQGMAGAQTPEPSSLALLMIAVAAACYRRMP